MLAAPGPPLVSAATAGRVASAVSAAAARAASGGREWTGGLDPARLYACGTVGALGPPASTWAVGTEEEERAALGAALAAAKARAGG